MTRIRSFARIAATMSIIAALAVPSFAARGSADFTRFVALGDSYGAGFEAGSLNQNHQPFGWPAIIARQVGLQICTPSSLATDNCFAIPLISNPGLPGGELVFNGSTLVTVPGSGAPLMAGFGRPYDFIRTRGQFANRVTALAEQHRSLWLGRNRPGGLDDSASWLENLRRSYDSGTPDPEWGGWRVR